HLHEWPGSPHPGASWRYIRQASRGKGQGRLMKELPSDYIAHNGHDDALDRRGFLKCMAWAGTGVIWSINGGLLTSTVLGQAVKSASAIASAELNFVQISDSHIGFDKPANTDVLGTFRETITRINALPKVPEFMLHTGDLTHLSDPA